MVAKALDRFQMISAHALKCTEIQQLYQDRPAHMCYHVDSHP